MKDITQTSGKLQEAIFDTLEHCAVLKKDEDDTPFVPFAMVTKNNESSMRAFFGEKPEYAAQMFEKIIKEENPEMVIYAYDGYLSIENNRTDAILIKAYEKEEAAIFLVGQRYIPLNENEPFQLIGNPIFMGTELLPAQKPNSIPEGKKNPWWKF